MEWCIVLGLKLKQLLLLVLEKSAELESAVRACCSSVSHEFKTYRMNGTAAVLAS